MSVDGGGGEEVREGWVGGGEGQDVGLVELKVEPGRGVDGGGVVPRGRLGGGADVQDGKEAVRAADGEVGGGEPGDAGT